MTPLQLLHHTDTGLPWPEHLQAGLTDNMAQAYQTALAARQLRVHRGEVPRGFKIGFTNRNIWPTYGVYGPIWGTVYSSTLVVSTGRTAVSLANTCQPRLEPEVVFGLKSTPPPHASMESLFECIDWVAPGFEIVQSHAPNWKFTAAMTVADGGLHAKLVVGNTVPVRNLAASASALNEVLAACPVTLMKDGLPVDRGTGGNVLGSPLLALHHFLNELRACPDAPDLQAADLVTTGTWTDAWPIAAGETWEAQFGEPLGSLALSFT